MIEDKTIEQKFKYPISVIMPTYNTKEEFLREAIESVLAQTFNNFEFIIVDNASSDYIDKVVSSYNDNRIKFIKNEQNFGLGYSLNLAMKLSKGKYVARIDSDDVCFPERFQKQFDFMESHQDIDICGSYAILFGDNTNEALAREPITHIDIKTGLFFTTGFLHPSVIFRQSTILKYNLFYCQELKLAEDLELWHRAAPFVKFHNIPEPLIKYRYHANNLTRIDNKLLYEVSTKLYKNYFKQCLGVEIDEDIMTAFRTPDGFSCRYTSEQINKMIKTRQKLLDAIHLHSDEYNVELFEYYINEKISFQTKGNMIIIR